MFGLDLAQCTHDNSSCRHHWTCTTGSAMTETQVVQGVVAKAKSRIAELERKLEFQKQYLQDVMEQVGPPPAQDNGYNQPDDGYDGPVGPQVPPSRRITNVADLFIQPKTTGLPDTVFKLLQKSDRALSVAEIVAALEADGYEWKTKQEHYAAVFSAIRRPKVFKKVAKGCYTVAKE